MNICKTIVENLWYSETKRQHVQRYVETIFLVKLEVEENIVFQNYVLAVYNK